MSSLVDSPITTDPDDHGHTAGCAGCLDRRQVLVRAGLVTMGVAAAGVLAACGGGSSSGSKGPAPAADGSIAKVSDVPVGGAISAKDSAGNQIILTQPTSGQVVALSAICTHQGCTVAPAKTQLVCPCHGSVYEPERRQHLRPRADTAAQGRRPRQQRRSLHGEGLSHVAPRATSGLRRDPGAAVRLPDDVGRRAPRPLGRRDEAALRRRSGVPAQRRRRDRARRPRPGLAALAAVARRDRVRRSDAHGVPHLDDTRRVLPGARAVGRRPGVAVGGLRGRCDRPRRRRDPRRTPSQTAQLEQAAQLERTA